MGAIVFVKHEGACKEFVFSVPVSLMHVKKGDFVMVDTMYGRDFGTVTSQLVECSNIEEVAQKFGAYLPLKPILSVVDSDMVAYIERRCQERIMKKIMEVE